MIHDLLSLVEVRGKGHENVLWHFKWPSTKKSAEINRPEGPEKWKKNIISPCLSGDRILSFSITRVMNLD
jgi:serine kinase of HPr protein (carbohydrate metabolism regulator)